MFKLFLNKMEVNSKYFFLLLLFFVSFSLSKPVLIDSTYTWYNEIEVTDQSFKKIRMIDSDLGFCMSTSKDVGFPGKIHEYKNDQWQ